MWIVRFEFVSPNTHPEYYLNEAPRVPVSEVQEADWTAVAVSYAVHPKAVGHLRGLRELERQGELIRNPKISRVIDAEIAGADGQLAQLKDEVVDAQTYSGGQDQPVESAQGHDHRPHGGPHHAESRQAYPPR
jgi:hypothetical protein